MRFFSVISCVKIQKIHVVATFFGLMSLKNYVINVNITFSEILTTINQKKKSLYSLPYQDFLYVT